MILYRSFVTTTSGEGIHPGIHKNLDIPPKTEDNLFVNVLILLFFLLFFSS
jgi:hypothetical protein